MATAANKSHSLSLSIVIGIAIGVLAALLSAHVAVWLIAGMFVGIAAGALIGQKKCPECKARQHASNALRVEQRSTRITELRANG